MRRQHTACSACLHVAWVATPLPSLSHSEKIRDTPIYSLPSLLHRGQNTYGQVGDGYTTDVYSPTLVGGSLNFTQISVALSNACGVTVNFTAYCWG